MDRDLSQPTRVVEGCRESLRLTETREDPPKISQRAERIAQGEPEINGLLVRGALLWQMREGAEGLLEGPHSLAVGRPRQGLVPRLPRVCQGLVPHLSTQGMM